MNDSVKAGLKIIFNADDFGITEKVSEAICSLIENSGVLKSTTVMANLVNDNSVRSAHSTIKKVGAENVSFGMHFNLTCGKPSAAASKIGTLVNADGNFKKFDDLVNCVIDGKIDLDHVMTEFMAQLELFYEKFGFMPSHIDSHKHMHCIPEFFDICLGIMKSKKINKTRLPLNINAMELFTSQGIDSARITSYFAKFNQAPGADYSDLKNRLAKFINDNSFEVKVPGWFLGTYTVGKLSEGAFNKEISEMNAGTKMQSLSCVSSVEYMVHPGMCDDNLKKLSGLLQPREYEHDALMSAGLKNMIKDCGFIPVSFNQL